MPDRKRSNGEGTIFYNKSKKYYQGSIWFEQKRHFVYGKTKKDASTKLEEKKRQLNIGIDVSSTLNLGIYLQEYLELEKNAVAYVTWREYRLLINNHIDKRLGKYRLNKLNPMNITTAWNKMISDGKGISTVKHCQALLSTALNKAVGRGLINQNPCNFATTPKANRKEITIIDEQDIARILDYTADYDKQYLPVIFLAFQTGMRRGELCALKWRDVDLLGMNIQVVRSWGKLETGYGYKAPKNGKTRSVDLTVGANMFLRELKEQQTNATEDSHVFRYSDGRNMIPDTLTNVFKRIAKKVGMLNIHFHNTRHSHAGILLKMGVHPKVVQERLGHSSIQVTMDIYSHIAPNMQRDAIKDFPIFAEIITN